MHMDVVVQTRNFHHACMASYALQRVQEAYAIILYDNLEGSRIIVITGTNYSEMEEYYNDAT